MNKGVIVGIDIGSTKICYWVIGELVIGYWEIAGLSVWLLEKTHLVTNN